jgi:2-polyprenyl-6-methoxyphenol hydroxylase-like FAD-dependent oxidoreductase
MAQVVIVGAGPAGAALAYLLARRGIGVTLLERQTDFAREFRGEGLMPSGVDALVQMGLERDVDALPQRRLGCIEIFRGAQRLVRLALTPEQIGAFGPRMVSQPALLEMLTTQAGQFPSFRLERGVTARDLLRDERGRVVGVRAEDGGGRDYRGDLVIGTDGRTSVLRHRAGLHEERSPQAFDVVWCKVPLPAFLADGVTARAYLGRGHAALMFPSWDGRLQLGWIIAKGTFGDLRRHGVDVWLEEMARHVSPDLAAHLRAERAAITQPFLLDVVCDRLVRWTAPGLLLLGDAAHPMSPVGAQGINIALRDALVAANHLCPALERGDGPDLLDAAGRRIEEERLPEVSAIQELQQAPPRVLFGGGAWRGVVVGVLLTLLVRAGLFPRVAGPIFRRFASGVTPVRLEV